MLNAVKCRNTTLNRVKLRSTFFSKILNNHK